MKNQCAQPTCTAHAYKHSPEGYCYGHHLQKLAQEVKPESKPKKVGRPPKYEGVTCISPDCGKPAVAQEMCSACYQKARRNWS